MASENIIDIDSLIQPITEDLPQGEDIREDRSPSSDYYTIKDARNAARAAERAGLFDEEAAAETAALWKPVRDLAPKILAKKSKDLEIVSWYIEAQLRLQGFIGLRDGIRLAKIYVEQFWDGLYPQPDEDGLETKVGPLTGLNGDGGEGSLLAPMRNTAITDQGHSYWEYHQALEASKITAEDKRTERIEALGFSLDEITAAINGGSETFYMNLIEDLQQAVDDYKALNDLLREHCGQDAPPSSNIRNLLDETLRAVRFITKDKLAHLIAPAESLNDEVAETDNPGGATPRAIPGGNRGPITDREQALYKLQEVANYFRTYEPHTPLAATIDRVVKWGRMTVAELMMELVPDDTARSIFTQLTGVKLDGTAEGTYVPPPVAAPSADKPAATIPEEADDNTGWGNSKNEQW